jgi:hypothetical protein
MKTFSSLKEEVKQKYELKDSLRNEIYSLIENSLSIKISNEESLDKDININGTDELVEKIKNLVDEVRIKERTFTLETVKANVYRNFDMKWLNEQISNLNKIKIGSEYVLTENIKDANVGNEDRARMLQYFVKKLHERKQIGGFEFSYEPSEGIFKFTSEDDGAVVVATPFFNDESGIPIEVFSVDNLSTHVTMKQVNFNPEEILYARYERIMTDFLVDDYEGWIKKVEKAEKVEEPELEDVPFGHAERMKVWNR